MGDQAVNVLAQMHCLCRQVAGRIEHMSRSLAGLCRSLAHASDIIRNLLRPGRGLVHICAIPWVAIPCSLTDELFVAEMTLISEIVRVIDWMARTALLVAC